MSSLEDRIRLAARKRRELDRQLSNQREFGARLQENAAYVRARLRACWANNTYVAPRRNLIADRDIFEEIQRLLRCGDVVRLTKRTPAPVIGEKDRSKHHISYAKQLLANERRRVQRKLPLDVERRVLPIFEATWDVIDRINKQRRRRGENERTFWVPRWVDTGPMLKAMSWGMVCYEGGGQVLNLNPTELVLRAAHADPRQSPARHLRERVRRSLAQEFGAEAPDFFFTLERPVLNVAHLHGAIMAPCGKFPTSRLRNALYRAVTDAAHVRSATDVHMVDLDTPVKWIDYCAKWVRGAQDRSDASPFAATSGMRKRAKNWYEDARSTEIPIPGHLGSPDPFGLYGS